MLKKYNNHILCRFFEKIADIWSSAAEYQVFVILAAMVLLAIIPLFGTKSNDGADVILNIIIFCALAVAGFFLLQLKGSHMAAFTFAAALLLRLCLVFMLEYSTPNMLEEVRIRTQPWIRHYDSVLFQPDEYFYVYQGQRYKDITISEFVNSLEFEDQACRAGFLLSRIFLFFGEQSLWPRLIGAFLGAFAAAIVSLAAKKLFSRNTAVIVSLLSALAPGAAFYSVRFLKEIWIIFATSLIIIGFVMIIRNRRPLVAIISIVIAIVILMWIRLEYSLMFISVIPLIYCFRNKIDAVKRMAVILIVIILMVIIFVYQSKQLAYKAEYLYDRYTLSEQSPHGKIEMMDKIYKSRGQSRILNIPLALLNPPPKNLHLIYTADNGFYNTIQLSDIYQWWLPLPFLIIGAVTITIKHREFIAFLASYISATIISAMLLGGLEPNLLRYRDSLAPVAFIIIGIGIESFMALPKGWKNKIILAVYSAFILLAVYFYARGF